MVGSVLLTWIIIKKWALNITMVFCFRRLISLSLLLPKKHCFVFHQTNHRFVNHSINTQYLMTQSAYMF